MSQDNPFSIVIALIEKMAKAVPCWHVLVLDTKLTKINRERNVLEL